MMERRAAILEFIQSREDVSTEEVFGLFPDRTPKTIRRDLMHLEEAGAILRSHGRARVNKQYQHQPEAYYAEREVENMTEKERIAALAATLVGDSRSIFLDAGTTMMSFAQHLPDRNLTVLTAAPNIALYIVANKPACTVLLTGGNLNPKTLSCSGYGSAEMLKMLNIDMAFMATSAYAPASGFSVGEHFEGELKRAVTMKAEKIVVLMDSSKLNKSMPYTFARPQDIDVLVCDRRIDRKTEQSIAEKGVKIMKAE